MEGDARGPLAAREALAIGVQIASAIEAAHERGVVHRDLKPGNVMITPTGVAKVLDFGLAKTDPVAASGSEPTQSATAAVHPGATVRGTILGTAAYMSPEQARSRPVDRRRPSGRIAAAGGAPKPRRGRRSTSSGPRNLTRTGPGEQLG